MDTLLISPLSLSLSLSLMQNKQLLRPRTLLLPYCALLRLGPLVPSLHAAAATNSSSLVSPLLLRRPPFPCLSANGGGGANFVSIGSSAADVTRVGRLCSAYLLLPRDKTRNGSERR